jgi:hypothetical protein
VECAAASKVAGKKGATEDTEDTEKNIRDLATDGAQMNPDKE